MQQVVKVQPELVVDIMSRSIKMVDILVRASSKSMEEKSMQKLVRMLRVSEAVVMGVPILRSPAVKYMLRIMATVVILQQSEVVKTRRKILRSGSPVAR